MSGAGASELSEPTPALLWLLMLVFSSRSQTGEHQAGNCAKAQVTAAKGLAAANHESQVN